MARRRVLIIDDEPVLGEALCELLSEVHDVELATTARDGVRRLREDASFEVVLCDLQLRDASAVDVYTAYRATWPGREGRIVFVSGGTTDDALLRFLETTDNRYLSKPFDVEELPRVIEEVAFATAS